jgi:hypothetical protein
VFVFAQIDRKTREDKAGELSLDEALSVVREAFITAGEVSCRPLPLKSVLFVRAASM